MCGLWSKARGSLARHWLSQRNTPHRGLPVLGATQMSLSGNLLRVHSPQSLVSELLGSGANTQNRGAPKSGLAIGEDKIHLGRAPSYTGKWLLLVKLHNCFPNNRTEAEQDRKVLPMPFFYVERDVL